MEYQTPFNPDYVSMTNQTKKPSNTISWLGFSFSLFVFLLLCFAFITMAYSVTGESETAHSRGAALLMLVLIIGFPIGLAGLILSIIGVLKASNKGGKKWIGACGLIFTGLSILSIIAHVFIATVPKSQTVEDKLPENRTTDLQQEKGVLLYVDGYQLKCFDNRQQKDNSPYETHIEYTYQIQRELDVWFKMNNIEKGDDLILMASPDTDYTQVADLMEALNRLGMNKFQLTSSLKNP